MTHDEGFYGIDAFSIVQRGNWRIFYEGNSGNEPLFFYFQAIALWLWGVSPFALRVFPAFIGILTVPSIYLLTKRLYGVRDNVPTFAAAVLAILYWHVHFSRMSLRAITLPLVEIWVFYFFWRGWRERHNEWRDFALSGLFLGLSAYTFTSARLLPLILVVIVAGGQIRKLANRQIGEKGEGRGEKEKERRCGAARSLSLISSLYLPSLSPLSLLVFISILTFAPLGYYFLAHPRAFVHRAGQVVATPDTIPANTVKTALMFFTTGDEYWAHNVARRPVLDIILAIFFVIGLARILRYIGKGEYAFLPLWGGVMLLPTILSDEAPHALRAIGAIPPVAITIALGNMQICKYANTQIRKYANLQIRKSANMQITKYANALTRPFAHLQICPFANLLICPFANLLICSFALLISGVITYYTYFIVWARQPEVAQAFEADRISFVSQVEELAERGDVYVPLELYRHPVTNFLLSRQFPIKQPVSDLPRADNACFIAPPGFERSLDWVTLRRRDQTVYIPPPLTAPLSLPNIITCADVPSNKFAAVPIQPFAGDGHFQSARHLSDQIQLQGYTLFTDTIAPGEPLRVALYWHALRRVREDYEIFVHLLDVNGAVWGNGDHQPIAKDYVYPTTAWRAGETIPDRCVVEVDPDIPPGKYTLEVGLYNWLTGERLAVGQDDRVLLGAIKVAATPPDTTSITAPRQVNLGDKITFLGYNIGYTRESINLELFWRGEQSLDTSYTVFVHLVDNNGQIVAQVDSPPRRGAYPTDIWDAGEVVRDAYEIPLPPDLPRGAYNLLIGVYNWQTGERLPAFAKDGERLPADSILLQSIVM